MRMHFYDKDRSQDINISLGIYLAFICNNLYASPNMTITIHLPCIIESQLQYKNILKANTGGGLW